MSQWLLPVEAGLVRNDLAGEVISPPYDLLPSAERMAYAARVPRSFLNGTPSSESEDPEEDAPARRDLALRYLEERLVEDAWIFNPPGFYVYRIRSGNHVQTGVVGDVPASAFPGLIRPHEHTRPTRVADLVDYLERVRVGSSPVGLTYRRQPEIDGMVALIIDTTPDLDLTLEDGDRQTVWAVTNSEAIEGVSAAFADVRPAYIVDGHHRVAATLHRSKDPATAAGRYLAVAFPDDDLAVHPFHRWVDGDWAPLSSSFGDSLEARPGVAIAVTRQGEWEIELGPGDDDATALARRVLGPELGIADERTDPRLRFIPGYPGPEALRAKVATEGGVGFLLHPPTVAAVMAVCDAGGVMPPKTTFFAPKPRSGVFLVRR